MSLRVGQRVRIVLKASRLFGEIGVIHRIEENCRIRHIDGNSMLVAAAYFVEVPGHGKVAPCGLPRCYQAQHIEPIRDDDTNTVVSWSQCAWKPLRVRA